MSRNARLIKFCVLFDAFKHGSWVDFHPFQFLFIFFLLLPYSFELILPLFQQDFFRLLFPNGRFIQFPILDPNSQLHQIIIPHFITYLKYSLEVRLSISPNIISKPRKDIHKLHLSTVCLWTLLTIVKTHQS